MNKLITKIENNVQDRTSLAWQKLCEYIDKVAAEGADEFSPLEELGPELFAQINTLPESISKLKKVRKVWLYGSKLKRIPPEIGEMESLEYFDPYTSYDLHWFPYEIKHCKNLKDSRVSTRALYGNFKNRMGFPRLTHNPVRYLGDTVKCSVCRKDMTYDQTNQLWISLWVGTDVLPLLANLCSQECEAKLPKPPEEYLQFPHKGGADLKQPPDQDELFEQEMKEWEANEAKEIKQDVVKSEKQDSKKPIQLIKGNQQFTIPNNIVLQPGRSILVTSGPNGVSGDGKLLWTNSYIWSNSGDPGRLIDDTGRIVATSSN